ncbi:MAG TPA: iron-regulated protein [Bacteroidales bacterium]|nr:iron-regulated protein [Bacteroidales bacterium]
MKKYFLLTCSLMAAMLLNAQEKPAYQIFTGDGGDVKYGRMMKQLEKADFVFYGELHNNAIAHWLELEITRDLFESKGQELVLGAEMFEADNQILIQEFWDGFLPQKKFEEDVRLWKNYPTDYKPLLMFAREKNLPFIATNVPRRYASMVASKGFAVLDSLSDLAKTWLPPLPIPFDPEVPCYKNMLSMMGGGPPSGPMGAHGGSNIIKAQALKDATMAWFIHQNYKPGNQFIHYNGSYHSDSHEGIIWYLKKYYPEAKILVITTVSQDETDKLADESKGKADFVVVVPIRMTNTY